MCSKYPGIKLELAFGTEVDKIEHLSSYAHVVHTTAKQIIPRRRKDENVFRMSIDEKCSCKECKNIVFHCQICKFVGVFVAVVVVVSWAPYCGFDKVVPSKRWKDVGFEVSTWFRGKCSLGIFQLQTMVSWSRWKARCLVDDMLAKTTLFLCTDDLESQVVWSFLAHQI